jgi:hypothetical protein
MYRPGLRVLVVSIVDENEDGDNRDDLFERGDFIIETTSDRMASD